jgi:hypothetical protein
MPPLSRRLLLRGKRQHPKNGTGSRELFDAVRIKNTAVVASPPRPELRLFFENLVCIDIMRGRKATGFSRVVTSLSEDHNVIADLAPHPRN